MRTHMYIEVYIVICLRLRASWCQVSQPIYSGLICIPIFYSWFLPFISIHMI